jgi:hypothetical protein
MSEHGAYLSRPLFSGAERETILYEMAGAAWVVYAGAKGLDPDFGNLPYPEQEIWIQAMRRAFRTMFYVLGDAIDPTQTPSSESDT